MAVNQKKERGSVVVEASIVLPTFMIAVFLVINMVNVFAVHNRVQFALNAAAHELASYSYLYAALHFNNAEQTIENDGNPYTSKIDQASSDVLACLDQIQALKSGGGDLAKQAGDLARSGQNVVGSVGELVKDPKGTAIGVGYMLTEAGIYQLKSGAATVLARTLTKKYLELDGQSADDYLESVGVSGGYRGLNFGGSTLLNDTGSIHNGHRMIDFVVEYDIDLSAFHLLLGDEKLHVVQRVTMPAWQDGDGIKPPKL